MRKTERDNVERFASARGFSLLELMISMFILIILISVAVPTYQRTVQHARETVLHESFDRRRRIPALRSY